MNILNILVFLLFSSILNRVIYQDDINTMPITFFTSNTRGNFRHPGKMDEICRHLVQGDINIVFIQEGGPGQSGPFMWHQSRHRYQLPNIQWNAYSGCNVGSYNERCQNYVLVQTKDSKSIMPVLLTNEHNAVVIGGGDAGRSPAAIVFDNKLLLISWHSLAGENDQDTQLLIRALEGNPQYRAYRQVIIGGDFNSTPLDLFRLINAGTERSIEARNYKYRYVVKCDKPTHSSGKELDFFIILSMDPINTPQPNGMAPTRRVDNINLILQPRGMNISDHNIVKMSYTDS